MAVVTAQGLSLTELVELLPGRSYQIKPYLIGQEKVREFASAIGELNPLYHDAAVARSAGYADIIAPPTFATVITMGATEQLLADPEIGIDLRQLVHGDQRFIFHRPICAGDELAGLLTVDKARSMAGNAMVSTRAVIETVEAEPIAIAEATLVIRGTL